MPASFAQSVLDFFEERWELCPGIVVGRPGMTETLPESDESDSEMVPSPDFMEHFVSQLHTKANTQQVGISDSCYDKTGHQESNAYQQGSHVGGQGHLEVCEIIRSLNFLRVTHSLRFQHLHGDGTLWGSSHVLFYCVYLFN